MTKREIVNRKRCIDALNSNFKLATVASWGRGLGDDRIRGELLYGFLDAAVGRLRPSEADKARSNALQFLRRRAKAMRDSKPRKSPSKPARGLRARGIARG